MWPQNRIIVPWDQYCVASLRKWTEIRTEHLEFMKSLMIMEDVIKKKSLSAATVKPLPHLLMAEVMNFFKNIKQYPSLQKHVREFVFFKWKNNFPKQHLQIKFRFTNFPSGCRICKILTLLHFSQSGQYAKGKKLLKFQ